MIVTFTINKLTIIQSLAAPVTSAFLISCDINYSGVQDLRKDVTCFYYCIKFIEFVVLNCN